MDWVSLKAVRDLNIPSGELLSKLVQHMFLIFTKYKLWDNCFIFCIYQRTIVRNASCVTKRRINVFVSDVKVNNSIARSVKWKGRNPINWLYQHILYLTHIAQKIDEWVVAAVRHGQHVAAKPDHIDVLVTEKNTHEYSR